MIRVSDPTTFDPDVFLREVEASAVQAIEHATGLFCRGETEDLEGTARVRLAEMIVGPVIARTGYVRGPARPQ